MSDTPVSYNAGNNQTWTPLNYERRLYGKLSLRQALAHSNNVIAVKLLDAIGVPKFVDFASKMGLSLRGRNDLSLALGTAEVTLNELVSAYTSLADGGKRTESRTIVRIFERSRRTWTEIPPAVAPVLNPATAFVTTQMLKDVMIYGTAKKLKKFSEAHPSAGKTGTTDDYRDAWFVGYTPQIITGVWVGYDKPKPGGKGFTGGAVSAPIWERFMRKALAARPAVGFPRPDGVVTVRIDPFTDQLATPNCPVTREEFYIAGTEPTKYCSRHGGDSLETGGAVAPLPAALEEKSSPPPDDNLSPKQNQKEQPGESLPGQ
jgi:membrane carboxypeptidase/penicillin-binding protein